MKTMKIKSASEHFDLHAMTAETLLSVSPPRDQKVVFVLTHPDRKQPRLVLGRRNNTHVMDRVNSLVNVGDTHFRQELGWRVSSILESKSPDLSVRGRSYIWQDS